MSKHFRSFVIGDGDSGYHSGLNDVAMYQPFDGMPEMKRVFI